MGTNFYQLWMLVEAKAPSIYMYHGTSDKLLPTILSQGLAPYPKKRTWAGDSTDSDVGIGGSWHTPSKMSLGGIYLTRNVITAEGAARNAVRSLGGKNKVIVICQVQPRSLYADEDEVHGRIDNVVFPGYLTTEWNSWQLFCAYERLRLNLYGKSPNPKYYSDDEYREWKQGEDRKWVEEAQQEYVKAVLGQMEYEHKDRWHPELARRLQDIISHAFPVVLRRLVAHGAKSLGRYDIEKEGVSPPNPEQAERDFKTYQDQLTRTLKRIAARPDNLQGNARSVQPIGFSGANRIVGVVEVVQKEDGHEWLRVRYGSIPEEFRQDYEKRVGEMRVL